MHFLDFLKKSRNPLLVVAVVAILIGASLSTRALNNTMHNQANIESSVITSQESTVNSQTNPARTEAATRTIIDKESHSEAKQSNSTSIDVESDQSAVQGTTSNSLSVESTSNDNESAQSSLEQKKNVLQFTKGGYDYEKQTAQAHISLGMNETSSGTCTYVFYLNDIERYSTSNRLSRDKFCEVYVPVENFPKSATYDFSVAFLSDDGLTSAYTYVPDGMPILP